MHRRMVTHNYALPGIYHITLHVAEGTGRQPLGQVEGSLEKPDNTLEGPHVILTPIGEMVREELLTSITAHYSMAVIDSFVIMPEHLHALIIVKEPIVSRSGRPTHLGQVIAGFKKGCNRRYWAMTEQGIPTGKPLATLAAPIPAAPVSGGSAAAAPVLPLLPPFLLPPYLAVLPLLLPYLAVLPLPSGCLTVHPSENAFLLMAPPAAAPSLPAAIAT